MKKAYVTPCAMEETFVANSYVAGCAWHITSTAGNNRMQCANPSHSHFMNGTYFTSVWVAATNSTCKIKVDSSGIKKTDTNGDNAHPLEGATVYGEFGKAYTCTETYTRNEVEYYVPRMVKIQGKFSDCYGTYVNEGTYEEIAKKVLS